MTKNKAAEEDMDELLEDDEEEEEDEEESEEEEEEVDDKETYPKRLPSKFAKKVEDKKASKSTPRQPSDKKFKAFYSPERAGIAFADSDEIYAEGIPEWGARMYADLKNDLEEIKDILGRM